MKTEARQTPDRPGGHHCDICGCADQEQIEPGPDKDTFGADSAPWMCTDANARACEARARHSYPPRPDLVHGAVLAALFVMRFVPETKQRSLEAIEGLWGKAPAPA